MVLVCTVSSTCSVGTILFVVKMWIWNLFLVISVMCFVMWSGLSNSVSRFFG